MHDATATVKTYSLAASWQFVIATNTDGRAGNELVFSRIASIGIFHEASAGTLTQYFLGDTPVLLDAVDTDGRAGNELVFDVGNTVKIVRDANRTSRSYFLSDAWTYLGALQVDGFPGLELLFSSGGSSPDVDGPPAATEVIVVCRLPRQSSQA